MYNLSHTLTIYLNFFQMPQVQIARCLSNFKRHRGHFVGPITPPRNPTKGKNLEEDRRDVRETN